MVIWQQSDGVSHGRAACKVECLISMFSLTIAFFLSILQHNQCLAYQRVERSIIFGVSV